MLLQPSPLHKKNNLRAFDLNSSGKYLVKHIEHASSVRNS